MEQNWQCGEEDARLGIYVDQLSSFRGLTEKLVRSSLIRFYEPRRGSICFQKKGTTMMVAPRQFALSTKMVRSATIAALFGAAMLSIPSNGAIAAEMSAGQPDTAKAASHRSSATSAAMKQETIDQRIAGLHKSLKITAEEESAWAGVAQAMRDNETAMKNRIAALNAEPAKRISAVEDLKIYESFTQAHVDGLKNMITAFETLYASMPEPQKAVADQVFQRFGHKGTAPGKAK
jgi:hypothetical protein